MSIAELLISIANKMKNIKDNVLAAYDAVANKNGTIPEERTINNLTAAIASINISPYEEMGVVFNDYNNTSPNIVTLTSYDNGIVTNVIELVDKKNSSNYQLLEFAVAKMKFLFPQLKKITMYADKIEKKCFYPSAQNFTLAELDVEEINFPECTYISDASHPIFFGTVKCMYADFKKVKTITGGVFYMCPNLCVNPFRDLEIVKTSYFAGNNRLLGSANIDVLELNYLKSVTTGAYEPLILGGAFSEILFPSLTASKCNYTDSDYSSSLLRGNFSNLKKVVVGKLASYGHLFVYNTKQKFTTPNFIRLEIGDGTTANLILETWNPTNALSTESNDLVEGDFNTNLQQFLYNFRKHIVDRLATVTTAHTIKVSTAVFNVIQNDTEFDILTELSNKKWTLVDSGY